MIEQNKLLTILRRRAWVLALGLIVGLLVGYIVSGVQEPTYEAFTRLLVSNQLQGKNSDFAGLTNQQLVLTYIQLLKTKDLRDKASEKAGVVIRGSQLTIQQVPDTQIIEIRVQGNDPEQVATIANTMATTLFEEIESIRSAQFSTSEKTLTEQIEQAKTQIDTLQKEYDQTDKQLYQNQLTQVEKQIADIQTQISTLQVDIVKLSATPTIENRAQKAQKEAQVTQLQSSFKLYDELRTNLIILGKPTPGTKPEDDPQLQQLKSTITLYQKIYTDLLSTREAARLAQSQQAPNALQFQEAYAAKSPVAPVRSEYTFLSAVAGLVLAVIVLILLEVLGESIGSPEGSLLWGAKKMDQKEIS